MNLTDPLRLYGVAFCMAPVLLAPDGQAFEIPDDMDPRDRCNIRFGRYERADINLIQNWFQPDNTIIEIGANIGIVARYAFLKKLVNGGHYICLEPNPKTQITLAANMRRANAISPAKRFTIVKAAVCAPAHDRQEADFFVRPNLCSGLTSHIRDSGKETTIRVATRSLGSVMEEYAPHGASLICDAEGGEIPMILKDGAILSQVRQIAIELHDPSLTGRRETQKCMLLELEKLGFTLRAQSRSSYYLRRDCL